MHGASRAQAMRLIIPILAPAIWSALAIGFAESISDFGVAATLAYNSNFSLATYQLYAAIGNFPPSFPLAAAMGWLLVAAVAIPLALQARALRGRSYADAFRPDPAGGPAAAQPPVTIGAAAGVGLFFVVALGHPRLRRGERLAARRLRRLVQPDPGELPRPVRPARPDRAARALARLRRDHRDHHRDRRVHRGADAGSSAGPKRPARWTSCCSPSVALPGVVFGAGYIFAYNLPIMSRDRHQPVPDGDAADHRLHRVQPAHQRPGPGRRGVAGAAVAEGRGPGARRGRAGRLGPGRAARGVPADRHGLAVHLLRRVPRAAALPAALRAGITARLDRDRGQPQQLPLRRRHGPGRAGRGHRPGRGGRGARRLPAAGAGRAGAGSEERIRG